jgi:hypothetical protein
LPENVSPPPTDEGGGDGAAATVEAGAGAVTVRLTVTVLVVCGCDRVGDAVVLVGDQFVLIDRGAGDHGVFAGDQCSRVEYRLRTCAKTVLVEFGGADVALGAAAVRAAVAQQVVVAAVAVTVDGPVAAAHLVTVAADVAVTAFASGLTCSER